MKKYLIATSLVLFVLPCFAENASEAKPVRNEVSVTINVKNITKDQGTLMIALVSDPTDFPKAIAASTLKIRVPAKGPILAHLFADVKPGRYAVSVYQDLDNNEKLNRNFIGIPNEPYGVSGKPGFGKPKFDDCSLDIQQSLQIEISLKD